MANKAQSTQPMANLQVAIYMYYGIKKTSK